MNLHSAVAKPGLDEVNHCLVAFDSAKLGHGIFEENIFGVEAIGLVVGKLLIVCF